MSDTENVLNALQATLQQELYLSRELLANLHQEELSLILQDQGSWNQVMSDRAPMMERLSDLRTKREELAHQMLSLSGKKETTPLEELLPLTEMISYEIVNLRDQLIVLTERLNRQHHRNQHILELPEPLRHLPPSPSALPQPQRPKRKVSVATYNIKK